MGGKGKKRREKNFLAAHGGGSRLPPPPTASSINALPSKLRKLMSLSAKLLESGADIGSKNKKQDGARSESKSESKSSKNKDETSIKPHVAGANRENDNNDGNEENKNKKRKRKQVNDLRFEAEMEKLGAISKRRQRKKEYLKAKKKKKQKGNTDQSQGMDAPKRDEVKFGEVVQAPPKLDVIAKALKKPMDASHERLRLRAIEAYRSRKGWTNRPGVHLPPVSTSTDS